MEVSKIPKYTKLTKSERVLIASWKNKGVSNKRIAKLLGRNISTIGREINRNKFQDVYEPLHAQGLAEKRKLLAWGAKEPLKSKKIYSYTLDKLRSGWSPEQIAGRLKKVEHKTDSSWHICHETIYDFVYKPSNKDKKLWHYLRRKQGRRRSKGGRKVRRIRIPDRISIHDRPKIIEKRIEVGHWEGDSVVGRYRKSGIHTEYERVTSLTRIERLTAVNSEETIKAQLLIFSKLPKSLRKSDTLDNGSEMVKHKELTIKLGMQTYFADPYSSWQRGSNEYHNGLLRRYFPKKTDFTKVTQKDIDECVWEINNRPRKCLGFYTANEVFLSKLNNQRVAIQSGM